MSEAADYATILAEVQAQRAKPRPAIVRLGAVAGGGLAALLGVLLAVPLPEVGIPLLLVGLRLLALRFEWAAVAYAKLRWRWGLVRQWWRGKPKWVREVVLWGSIIAIILLVKWLLG